MADPKGDVWFPGIDQPLSANYTRSHGGPPGICTIWIPPADIKDLQRQGTLEFTYAGERFPFKDCIVHSVEPEIQADGFERWGVFILDRRWKWKDLGEISGFYNTRVGGKDNPSGVDPDTEKTPRELCELCLKALGETGYDVSQVPNTDRPEVEWEYTRPVNALSDLCDTLQCRIVLTLRDKVLIAPLGSGAKLPDGQVLQVGEEIDPPEVPDKIVIVGARSRFQVDLLLECVGPEFLDQQEIKLQDELSYTPDKQYKWLFSDPPFFENIGLQVLGDNREEKRLHTLRSLIQETAFRWYRIKVPFTLSDTGKEAERTRVKDLREILPLADSLQNETLKDGRTKKKAIVWGIFNSKHEDVDSTLGRNVPINNLEKHPQQIYPRAFDVDLALGIVKFDEPVWHYVPARTVLAQGDEILGLPNSGYALKPAILFLRIAVAHRDKKTHAWIHYEKGRANSKRKLGTKPRYERRDDIMLETTPVYKADGFNKDTGFQLAGAASNKDECDKAADHYIDALDRQYQLSNPGTRVYVGFRRVELDGAIQQVTFDLTSDGHATTRVSRNREEPQFGRTWKERRFIEKLREQLVEDARPNRAKAKEQAALHPARAT